LKVLFDVGDGSFTQNFYFYTIRVSDIEAAVQNTLTQLGAAQLVVQRATIDEETAAASNNQLATSSSAQTTPGDGQWVDILIPISSLTRVGNEQSQTLQNVNAIQYLFNMAGASDCSIGIASIVGGFQPDVGDSGAPYMYRVRPRSSVTGAIGNPSPAMRYGISPRREQVTVNLPSAAYDAQIDTWDIFRYGGTVTSWRRIGQTAATNTTFIDNYADDAAIAGDPLDFDNLEPWPSIDLPLNVASVTAVGTTAVVPITGSAAANVLRFLPGNLVRIGAVNVYTLRVRPTLISGSNYLFQFVENAGTLSGVPLAIYEPAIADQHLPYMWGPDAAGTVFAVGDPLRPGTVSFAKNYAPDNAPDSYNIEITPPSEPLLGGEILDGLSFVASSDRWWAMYPQPSNPLQRYSIVQQPMTRGLAAPFGHCNDGQSVYWWAKDSIQSSSKGSLTDADLYNIFPHDGVQGKDYTYNGQVVYAPYYAGAALFRLAYCNGYLYATYADSTFTSHTLVLHLATMAWSVDVLGGGIGPATVYYQPEQQSGSLVNAGSSYTLLTVGTATGEVYSQTDLTNDDTAPIQCAIATNEWDGGDIRAGEQWGDLWLYLIPASASVVATPMALSAPVAPATTVPQATAKTQLPISLGGDLLSDFLGMQITWADDFSTQTSATVLEAWQPSFIPKPEITTDRFTDWYDGGTEQAKYMQGFLLHADTGQEYSSTLINAITFTGFQSSNLVSTAGLTSGVLMTLGTGASQEKLLSIGIAPGSVTWEPVNLHPAGSPVSWGTAPKGIVVRDGDTLTTHPFTPVVQQFGESIKAYSFTQPFIAHTVRLEPTDQSPWRFFDVDWIFEPTAEAAETWQTQGTAHGLQGYMHLKQVSPCYNASAAVTLTITSFDGQSPLPIILPATGGAMQKVAVMLTANKGQIYFYAATSSAPFQLFLENWEIEVGQWARQDNYLRYRNLGGQTGDQARV
jgi:hypothetical protein